MYRKIYNVLMEANCLLRNEIWFLWTHCTKHAIPLGDARPRWTLVWLVRDMQRHSITSQHPHLRPNSGCRPLLTVPIVTAHPSTASVPITVIAV